MSCLALRATDATAEPPARPRALTGQDTGQAWKWQKGISPVSAGRAGLVPENDTDRPGGGPGQSQVRSYFAVVRYCVDHFIQRNDHFMQRSDHFIQRSDHFMQRNDHFVQWKWNPAFFLMLPSKSSSSVVVVVEFRSWTLGGHLVHAVVQWQMYSTGWEDCVWPF